MEDEETGELFIPCRVCSHKCFKKHGKYHDKQCFDGSASFFKVMLGDFAERLVTFMLQHFVHVLILCSVLEFLNKNCVLCLEPFNTFIDVLDVSSLLMLHNL